MLYRNKNLAKSMIFFYVSKVQRKNNLRAKYKHKTWNFQW